MVNQEILEGIRAGLERGQPIKRIMMSFLNAGYSKVEIEEAASAVSQQPVQGNVIAPQIPVSTEVPVPIESAEKPKEIFPNVKQSPIISQPTVQKVSNYEKPKKQASKLMIIILIGTLVLLTGILVSFFLFKDSIIALFGG